MGKQITDKVGVRSALPLRFFLFVFLFALTSFETVLGLEEQVDRFDYKTQEFKNDRIEFKLRTNSYKVTFAPGDYSLGTTMYAEYTTNSIEELEDYAIVQYIRGCQFYSTLEGKKTKKSFDISRHYWNEIIKFIHLDWVVDSIDDDPMYRNGPVENRHGYYWWNEKPLDYPKATQHYVIERAPQNSRLYVSDLPGSAFAANGSAKNIALEFKTCLIETHKVPRTGAPDLDLRDETIKCFSWESFFVFNHKKGIFHSRKGRIQKICREKKKKFKRPEY
ncbi:MAG: hypothetical protein OXB88_01830 [Bacteriovoracales bacterium]|nr:hypothetical protein [Bacteriovoracales bacterium]